MNEIKFRAWDKEDEVMIDWFWLNSEGKAYETPVTLYDTPHLEIERNDDLIVMQYTGLKDKNGVGVFEGDYLSWISFESQKEFKGEVVFSKGSFCMVVRLKGHDYKVPLHELSEFDNLIEVLGNIYENPELLEVSE